MESLEERLLCVEINEVAAYVTQIVLEVVASIAPFVSFLTLSNRVHAHKAPKTVSFYVNLMLADCLTFGKIKLFASMIRILLKRIFYTFTH